MKPIAKWDSDQELYDGLIWWSKLDERYQVEVQGDNQDHYTGTLVIFDHQDGDKMIHSEKTGISYGAMWGADIADINQWCTRAIQIVDGLNAK